ncbi:hypothetical protein [Catenuloplanes atrovinosus]|uniref:Uncharacterized protein n=1 Tax=Catenuloplanes atrovinosus TaxID=137266 RepID=A0AAE3YS24_9ACTN|nr:hypothetical protein [Catenuloplanes atrovinosus]MDR7278933.1 hypothetical protein [Catenuloplanes atrovinosus]
MASRFDVRDTRSITRYYRRELLREMRREARRVRKAVVAAAPKRTGTLRRKIKIRAGWDAHGPFARITTTARRDTTSARTGRRTRFRYGLAIQQKDHYLQRGLQRTPRR